MQIVIQSNKEDLSKNIKKLKKQKEKEKNFNNKMVQTVLENYIHFIQEKNKEKLSSSKNFYLIIQSKNFPENTEESIKKELNEKYFKIKDTLSRCGNRVCEIKEEKRQEIY